MTIAERFLSKFEAPSPFVCWEWRGYRHPSGYGVLSKGPRGGGFTQAHRVSFEYFRGPIQDGKIVCHHCDNPGCVNPNHLFVGTIAENTKDRDLKNRQAKGERSARAVLTEDQVREIRASSLSLRKLAAIYGVGHSAISEVRLRKTWRHL